MFALMLCLCKKLKLNVKYKGKGVFSKNCISPAQMTEDKTGFEIFTPESKTVVTTVCKIPNMLVIPMLRIMKKKRSDHSTDPGNFKIASVKAMKASPVPCTS